MDQPAPALQIKASDETLRGSYANAMQISHTREEVTLDFFSVMPPQGQMVSRIITSPGHAKRILAALADNLAKYEARFGALEAASAPVEEIGFKAVQA